MMNKKVVRVAEVKDIIICDWTAAEVVRAYRRSGGDFDKVKKTFHITSLQLKRLLKQAGIDGPRRCRMNVMEDLGLRSGDFILERV